MFEFQPLTDEEISAVQNEDLLAKGAYDFVVKGYEEKVSEAGNPMIVIYLLIKNGNDDRTLKDFLMSSKKMIYKLKHFCESIGLEADYATGKIDPVKFKGRKGRCAVGIDKGKLKDDGTLWPDKNKVEDYVKPIPNQANGELPFADEIPF